MPEFDLMINGLFTRCHYSQNCIDTLFLPFLRKLTQLHEKLNRRIVVFLSAPPGCGKSTLAAFLEMLSHSNPSLTPLQAAGMDGFHYPQQYLLSHCFEREGVTLPMAEYKGCPETFDTRKLKDALTDLREKPCVSFPVYDRRLHDVKENALHLSSPIILLEGNWLLLDTPAYQPLQAYCDVSLFLQADPSQLKDRLIQRKIKGGLSPQAACAFYERSDRLNVQFCLSHSLPAAFRWQLDEHEGFTDSGS